MDGRGLVGSGKRAILTRVPGNFLGSGPAEFDLDAEILAQRMGAGARREDDGRRKDGDCESGNNAKERAKT